MNIAEQPNSDETKPSARHQPTLEELREKGCNGTGCKEAAPIIKQPPFAIAQAPGQPERVEFEALFNLADLQRIQDEFAAATGVASLITRPDGTPITQPSNFCRLCRDLIRGTELGRCNCYHSDALIGRHHADGPIIQPCLSGGLWDAGASITVGGEHVGNWLIGQVRDEQQSEAKMREYAQAIGADEDEVVRAFREVPAMSAARFQQIAQALFTLANQLSTSAFQNVQQARIIAELQRTEAALKRSEQRFRIVARLSSSFAYSCSQTAAGDYVVDWITDTFYALTGLVEAELRELGCWLALAHTEDRALAMEPVHRLRPGESDTREFRIVAKDGRMLFIINHLECEADPGVPGHFLLYGAVQDITERKRAEVVRTQLATAVEQAAEAIVITDTRAIILYVNPAFEKTSGYSRAEALGRNSNVLKSGRQDVAFYREMWGVLTRGRVWTGHFINRRKDGTLFEEEATISPVRNAAGKLVNYVAVKRDVTHEVQLQAQLRQSQKMEAIGQLAGGVAHDFNNILSSVLMQTELVGMVEGLPEEAREGLEQISADARRAADLTRQLLLFSRRQVMQSRQFDLNDVVTHLAKMLQRIIGEDVQLHLHLHCAPLLIQADAGMLDQVLLNLAVNARDAMPEGGRVVVETTEVIIDEEVARLNPDATPGRFACLSVSDTGGGIPPEILPRIFEPFFTTKEVGKGTGLGLATVFGIVKQHGGWIKLVNQLGQGATFKIFLPARAVLTAAGAPAASTKPTGGRETILWVEDEATVRLVTRRILERYGYTVLEADCGAAALKLWPEQRAAVTLLLTDLVMPGGLSGRELARQLQADRPQLKVIYTSGYSAEIAGRELELRSGENFIQKPFTPEQLLKTIRLSLETK